MRRQRIRIRIASIYLQLMTTSKRRICYTIEGQNNSSHNINL